MLAAGFLDRDFGPVAAELGGGGEVSVLPRRINQVCTTALMAGLIDKKTLIDETAIRKAIAEIDQD